MYEKRWDTVLFWELLQTPCVWLMVLVFCFPNFLVTVLCWLSYPIISSVVIQMNAPPPQLLRKGRIYCCWTCTQTDHKFGRCFLFLAHWGFYWLPSFFSLYFFFPLEVRARWCEGWNANVGNSKISLSSSVGVLKDRVLERLIKWMVLERGSAVERY